MDPAPGKPKAQQERRSIVLLTLGFIVVSAAVHFVLGGAIRAPWVHEQPTQSPIPFTQYRFVTPRPSPPHPPPTTRPRPRPQRAKPRPQAQRHPAHPAVTPPRVAPTPLQPATSLPQINAPAEPVVSPQPEMRAPSPAPLDARGIIISARFIHRVEPDYPELARQEGAEGTVIVLVTIEPDGTPTDVRVWESSGNPALDRAALQAAQQSTYAPPEVNGVPATQTYRIIYTFYLD